jgi:hypothetical protein
MKICGKLMMNDLGFGGYVFITYYYVYNVLELCKFIFKLGNPTAAVKTDI